MTLLRTEAKPAPNIVFMKLHLTIYDGGLHEHQGGSGCGCGPCTHTPIVTTAL